VESHPSKNEGRSIIILSLFKLSQHITAKDATLPAPAPCKNRKERATQGAYKFEATD